MLTTAVFFIVPITVGFLAELTKFLNHWRKHGWDISYSIAYGHMPSAHTAFVVSVVTTIGLRSGWHSDVFGLAVCFAVLVIIDALRLRVYMGQHAEYLNHLIVKFGFPESEFPRLKERVGHKPLEVLAGAVFGIILTWLLLWSTGLLSPLVG
jgi:acid phosphatase family membrane protein YuiD